MKIGQLASRANLNASAIRYYEKRGLLLPPERQGNQRRYPSDSLNRVLLIRFASGMGFTLNEIKLFLSGIKERAPVGPRWKKLAHRKLAEVEQLMQRTRRLKSLLEHLLRCRCSSLNACVTRLNLSPNLRSLRRKTRRPEAQRPGHARPRSA
ncbi:MAG: MerR family transcriptional regulator [Candidatus Acidiferrum sp.]|jgi:MerR family redox-sensitive transcriptional activator SoxR